MTLKIRKAVIPAAGHGTRLLPLTRSQPKEMVACGRAPVIGYILDELKAAGITEILLISRAGKASLEDFVFETWPGAFVVRQLEQKGLGHAVAMAESWVGGESFVVALGDTIIHSEPGASPPGESPLQRMIRQLPDASSSVVLVREVPWEQVSHYGIVDPAQPPRLGEAFALRDIIEKPGADVAPGRLAVAGRYIFSPAIFAALAETEPGIGGEIQVTDAMRRLCDSPGSLFATSLLPGERRFDIGTMQSYFEAFGFLSRMSQ